MVDMRSALLVAVAVLAAWVLAVWAAGLVYIAVTFVAARSYVPPRPLGTALRAALREAWLVALVQPMLPLFQIIGRHMGTGGGSVPVVLVHGYFQNRVDFLYLARRLRAAGSGPLYACNFFWPQSLERSSDYVRDFIAQVREETGAESVDVLTHSSGGLFALDVAKDSPELVRRAVLIALPGRGVPWRGPILGRSGSQLRADSEYQAARDTDVGETPTLSIYSVHDNVVHPADTSMVRGSAAENCEVDNLAHLAVLFDAEVGDRACEFLVDREPGDVVSVAE